MINLQGIQLDNKKIILIVLAFAVIIYVDYSYILKSQLSGKNSKSVKIIKLKKDLATLDKDFILMQQNRGKQIALPEVKRLILESEIPALLKYISGLANKNGIRITQMSPTKESKPSDVKPAKNEKEPQAPAFIPVKITLDLTCTYHRLGAFISELENSKDFIAVEELRIISDPANNFQEKVSLVLKTYAK